MSGQRNLLQAFQDKLNEWKIDPIKFAIECCGFKPSNQQKEFLRELCYLVWAKKQVNEYESGLSTYVPTEKEYWYADKFGISIMSAKGTGKDAIVCIASMWFLTLFEIPRIVCTSPTRDHLRQILWSEFSKWHSKTKNDGDFQFLLRDYITVGKEKIYLNPPKVPESQQGDKGVMIQKVVGLFTDEGGAEAALSGQHDDYMMILVDEAAGVHDVFFRSALTTLTRLCNFMVLIFNPHRRQGYAYNTHYDDKTSKRWITLQWSALDSDIVTDRHKQMLLETYSEGSDLYRINVLGLPANSSDGTLIPYDWVYAAKEREVILGGDERVLLGVDPAGGGKDSTMCCVKVGHVVKEFIEVQGHETQDQVKAILRICKEFKVDLVCIDSIGVGKGVYDMLKRFKENVYGVKVHEAAKSKGYKIYRDELYWRMREAFEMGDIVIPEDEKFIEEVSGISYITEKETRVERKTDMKKRLGRSPDRLDSLLVLFHLSETMFTPIDDEFDEFLEEEFADSSCSWMGY